MDNLLIYTKMTCNHEDAEWWVSNTGKKAIEKQKTTASELEHIIDFFSSDVAPKRLKKMSFKDAKRKAKEWSKSQQKKGKNLVDSEHDVETVHDFLNGNKIVKLKTNAALKREGYLMSHCVGSYKADSDEYEIYSYRDKKNMPHATFEVRKQNNEIMQIKGKGNGEIHPRYINPIITFLETIGMDVRQSEMRYLGYESVSEEQLEILNMYNGALEKIVTIKGNIYAF